MKFSMKHRASEYQGYRCPQRAHLFTCLCIRPWAGEAKNMVTILNRNHANISWDLVNIIASFMPPIARIWTRKSQGHTIKIVPNIQTPLGDDEIQEIP